MVAAVQPPSTTTTIASFTRDPIGFVSHDWNQYRFLRGVALTRLDFNGLDDTTIPHNSNRNCESCERMKPKTLEITPTNPGPNKTCKVTFSCEECEPGISGKHTRPRVDIVENPDGTETVVRGNNISIVICDRGNLNSKDYIDVIEHELVHARDLCNDYPFPPGTSECDKCKILERRAYKRQCEREHPNDRMAADECIEIGARNSCIGKCVPPNEA